MGTILHCKIGETKKQLRIVGKRKTEVTEKNNNGKFSIKGSRKDNNGKLVRP